MIVSIIFECALLIFLFMCFLYIISRFTKDNSIADRAWGIGFIIVALYSLIRAHNYTSRQLLVTTLILLWAIRLSIFITIRNWGKGEDVRYQKWRKQWGVYEPLLSFLLVFMLQGFFLLLISYEIIFINTNPQTGITLWDLFGLMVWIIGFIIETTADIHLYLFLHKQQNKGKILQTGLWGYSRHPNYFGEVVMWWAIFIIACQFPYGFTALISPLTITFLILFVSGIPLAEEQLKKNPEFEEYKRKTSIFIPWFKSN